MKQLQQRWQIAVPQGHLAQQLSTNLTVPLALAQVLLNRGINSAQAARDFLRTFATTEEPADDWSLPDPLVHFLELPRATNRLERAIRLQEKILICGDYDADGMTSTALLWRAIRAVGGRIDYAIPSRMTEGYGINTRIVEDCAEDGIRLIITVDNGIAAYTPIALAQELGIDVIVTDHHEVPEDPTAIPPAIAILNPKYRVDPASPYSTIAGVGMAYVLALTMATRFNMSHSLATPLLELFTLGTIADLAALTGVNRHLVQRGLQQLTASSLVGVQALINVSLSENERQQQLNLGTLPPLQPDVIGFRLGPRINAIGRIGDPDVVIQMLTTDDPARANDLAKICEQTNKTRQDLCAAIEREAVAYLTARQAEGWDLRQDLVLVIVDLEVHQWFKSRDLPHLPSWHHGVIGIVASRLVERYGAAVFIGSYEGASHDTDAPNHSIDEGNIRFSVRGIPEFHVFEALTYIADMRGKGGGHKAAGGFTLPAANLDQLRQMLREFAQGHGVKPEHIQPLVTVDAYLPLAEVSSELYQQCQQLEPCGMGNPAPVFYTPNVQIRDQKLRGKTDHPDEQHVSIQVSDGAASCRGIAWRWGGYYPLPERADVAYRLKENSFTNNSGKTQTSVEVELVGLRPAWSPQLIYRPAPEMAYFPPFLDLHTAPRPLPRRLLLYGYDRPLAKFLPKPTPDHATNHATNTNSNNDPNNGGVDVDRPLNKQVYASLVLWSLPPSMTHLRWLMATTQSAGDRPLVVYIGQGQPPIPTDHELMTKLMALLPQSAMSVTQPLDLLRLGQEWWVSPAVIVAGLRSLGYECPDFPVTKSLTEELQRLERWYQMDAVKLRGALVRFGR
jgi:single-stranded-DNA-specific exonuclease